MARTRPRPRPTQAQTLRPVATHCPAWGPSLRAAYPNRRTVTTPDAVQRLTLRMRQRPHPDCSRYRRPFPPEAEALLAPPHHQFGLDVLALVGRRRPAAHRSAPEIPPDTLYTEINALTGLPRIAAPPRSPQS
jgi:hypothetical protein